MSCVYTASLSRKSSGPSSFKTLYAFHRTLMSLVYSGALNPTSTSQAYNKKIEYILPFSTLKHAIKYEMVFSCAVDKLQSGDTQLTKVTSLPAQEVYPIGLLWMLRLFSVKTLCDSRHFCPWTSEDQCRSERARTSYPVCSLPSVGSSDAPFLCVYRRSPEDQEPGSTLRSSGVSLRKGKENGGQS